MFSANYPSFELGRASRRFVVTASSQQETTETTVGPGDCYTLLGAFQQLGEFLVNETLTIGVSDDAGLPVFGNVSFMCTDSEGVTAVGIE